MTSELRAALAALAFPPPKPARATLPVAERKRLWRLANLERERQRSLDCRARLRARDPDAYRARERAYWAANAERINALRRKRRRKGATL